jgi:hypothetical protein
MVSGIASTIREATFVLDEILDNETDLPIQEHTADTGGYTDLLFALFDLLGLQFSPRLRDLADCSLYRFDRAHRYPNLQPLFSQHHLRRRFILDHWDEMLHAAASSSSAGSGFPADHPPPGVPSPAPLTAALRVWPFGRTALSWNIWRATLSQTILVQTNKGKRFIG